MNTRAIVTVVAAAFFSVSLVPVSFAQEKLGSAQEGIEIITIIGKRPAPTLATACVNGVAASTDAVSDHKNADGSFSDEVLESRRTNTNSPQRATKLCNEQTTLSFDTQI
ncbi:MAG: hypothetical protein V4628_14905 [Pseudomonadota bacterium]